MGFARGCLRKRDIKDDTKGSSLKTNGGKKRTHLEGVASTKMVN
jgi:hypothetical protein